MMYKFLLTLLMLIPAFTVFGPSVTLVAQKVDDNKVKVVEKKVVSFDEVASRKFLHDPQMYSQGWDTLPQPKFWRKVIALSHDSAVINVASSRKVLCVIPAKEWSSKTELRKTAYKDSLRRAYNVGESESLYVTAGKREFYSYKKVVPSIGEAIKVFNQENCDPWFAQVILLIESPGKVQKSNVGAYGAFQLMKSVAIKYGLKVNKHIDERENFHKSAMAAARLIRRSCIPETKRILDARGLKYNEDDLWFRLMVLHSYHAGAGNVSAVIRKIDPCEGGIDLIREMWRTEANGFKNASQNYSQIGLASMVRFDELVYQHADTVYLVDGDRKMLEYQISVPTDTLNFLASCFKTYASDLIDETVPVQYFLDKIMVVEREVLTVCTKENCTPEIIEKRVSNYKFNEQQMEDLAQKLIKLRRPNDAIELLKVNVQNYPNSWKSYSSLAEAYKLTGNKELAMTYSQKAAYLNP